MQLSEQDKKRLQELVVQLEVVHDKIWVFLSPWKEGKPTIYLNLEQMGELKNLFDQQEQLTKEFMAIPNMEDTN